MKETTFIKQNKKKWARFEKLSGKNNNDPDEVSQLFTEITEDLSYARTFYPRRSVRVYLNQLAQGVFTSLYKQRKQPLGNMLKFWKETVPLEMYRARINLLAAFLFFVLAMVIGAVSQEYDNDFVRLILGDYYVDRTEDRIADGDPMGVYGESHEVGMFFSITLNNIMVSFYAFALGIFGTLGTYIILLYNGIMLGSFQWWFKIKGLLLTSFLAVWIHGAFEISSIIIAGAAGITLGNGILFPGSYSRMQSLIFSAKRGLTILMSLIPFFILAGTLESFVTRHYQSMPAALKWGIILFSFSVILLYYVIYPFIVARKYPDKIAVKEVPRHIPERKIEWHKIRKTGEVFTDTFYLFIKHFQKIASLFFGIIFPLAMTLLIVIYAIEYARFDYYLSMFDTMRGFFGVGVYFTWYKFLGWSLILALLTSGVFYITRIKNEEDPLFAGYFKFVGKHLVWMFCFGMMIHAIFAFVPIYLQLLLILLMPFIGMIPAIIVYEKKDFFTAFIKSFDIGKGSYGDALGTFAIFLLIFFIFRFALENPIGIFSDFDIISLINDLIRNVTITVVDRYAVVMSFVDAIIYLVFMILMLGIYVMSFAFTYHSSNEAKTAKGLYNRLEKFGKRNRQLESDVDYE